MGDPTPAEECRAAAAYVRVVVEANRAIAENRVIPVEVQGLTLVDVARADMHPAVGAALADLLDDLADGDDEGEINPWALAIAQAINGGPR